MILRSFINTDSCHNVGFDVLRVDLERQQCHGSGQDAWVTWLRRFEIV